MATGIRDKVAILGMGCSKFGERWDAGTPELLAEAFDEALADAGIERGQIEAAWYGSALDNANVGNSAIPASTALRLDGIPVSRMENMCATGTETLRGAAYAVASGAVDFALAIGAEKLKDTGYGGLPSPYKGTFNDLWLPLGVRARRVRPARLRLSRQARHAEGGPEARPGPRLLEEPPERGAQPQGPPAQAGVDGRHPERADDR